MAFLPGLQLRVVAATLRHTGIQRGRWRLHRRAMSLVHDHMPRDRTMQITTRPGFQINVDSTSQVGRVVYATGEYEPGVASVLRAVIGRGATFVDVGAHVGYFTLLAAQLVGDAGRVIAFEPQRAVREQLQRNVRLNALANVEIKAVAAFDSRGSQQIYLESPDSTGQASLRATSTARAETVETMPLDDLLGDSPVTAIKIDAEGAEHNALRGMRRILANQRPSLIVEVTDTFLREFDSSAESMVQFLQQFGYVPYLIDDIEGVSEVVSPTVWNDQRNVLFTCDRPPVISVG